MYISDGWRDKTAHKHTNIRTECLDSFPARSDDSVSPSAALYKCNDESYMGGSGYAVILRNVMQRAISFDIIILMPNATSFRGRLPGVNCPLHREAQFKFPQVYKFVFAEKVHCTSSLWHNFPNTQTHT